MNRYFIRYEMILKENAIVGNGGQIGNVLRTLDCVPGSTMLGATAKAYLQTRPAKKRTGRILRRIPRVVSFRKKTVYSPAYPSNDKGYQAFPVPMSVFGCKYSEGRTPERSNKPEEHGFSDCLFREVPRTCFPMRFAHSPQDGLRLSRRKHGKILRPGSVQGDPHPQPNRFRRPGQSRVVFVRIPQKRAVLFGEKSRLSAKTREISSTSSCGGCREDFESERPETGDTDWSSSSS